MKNNFIKKLFSEKIYKCLMMCMMLIMVMMLGGCGSKTRDVETSSRKSSNENESVKEDDGNDSDKKSLLSLLGKDGDSKDGEDDTAKESSTEEDSAQEAELTEYQLSKMDTGFYGGIAWATVSGDTGSKQVLINKELQIVYELPDGMTEGDIFDGKAAAFYSDQDTNPGFVIVGADGSVLYESTDKLAGGEVGNYNINFTKDGNTIYERNESGLTGNKIIACVLNEQFETVDEIEISALLYGEYRVYRSRTYVYLSEGVYCSVENLEGVIWVPNGANSSLILNTAEHTSVDIAAGKIKIKSDMDRCVGLLCYGYSINGEDIDYSGITDADELIDLIKAKGTHLKGDFYGKIRGYPNKNRII